MKKEIELNECESILRCGMVVLISGSNSETANIMPLSNYLLLAGNPPYVGLSIRRSNFTYQLLKSTGEFVVNIPHYGILKEIIYCGTVSGKSTGKFETSSLTPVPSKLVKPPSIKECIGHLECKVKDIYDKYGMSMIIGRVMRVEIEEDYYQHGYWDIEKIKLVHHIGNQVYEISGELVKLVEKK